MWAFASTREGNSVWDLLGTYMGIMGFIFLLLIHKNVFSFWPSQARLRFYFFYYDFLFPYNI